MICWLAIRSCSFTTIAARFIRTPTPHPLRPLRIWAERPRAQNAGRNIAVPIVLGSDDARSCDAVLNPVLERLQHAGARVGAWSHPLAKIVGDFAAVAVPHARHEV